MKIEEVVTDEMYAYTDHPLQRRTRTHIVAVKALAIVGRKVRVKYRDADREGLVSPRALLHTWAEELEFRLELRRASK